MKGKNFLLREVIKVKRYKVQVSKAKFGDLKTFHKNLMTKADLVLSDSCHQKNIQKEFESVMGVDTSVRIVPPREFIYRQMGSDWQASTQLMACWFQENRDELKKSFNQEFIGFKSSCGLRGLPSKQRMLQESETINKVINESLAFSRTITTEVQKVMADLKEELQKKKEAAFQDHEQAENQNSLFGDYTNLVVDYGNEDEKIDEDFNTEFRYSVKDQKHISEYLLRDSKDPGDPQSREPSEKPKPKLAQNSRIPTVLNLPEQNRQGIPSSSSNPRVARGGKKGGTKTQALTSLQTFFKNKKGNENPENDDNEFN
jgi:hypothetical protein